MNPPVIQVTQPTRESAEMGTEEPSAPPMTPELPTIEINRNPFLNLNEMMDEVQNEESGTPMVVDDSVPYPMKETNPFRRLSGERDDIERKTVQRDEIQS